MWEPFFDSAKFCGLAQGMNNTRFYSKVLIKPDGRQLFLYSHQPISDDIIATNPKHDPITPTTHLRWHPLRGEWVAYATHRQNRTFLPPKEYSPLAVTNSQDFPTELPAGDYEVAVFENLFPSLTLNEGKTPDLFIPTQQGRGLCEVVVFTQDADASLGSLPAERVDLVLEVIAARTKALGALPEIKYVLAFENKGVEVGVTLHHPHGQIYSYSFVPPVPAKMHQLMLNHWQEKGSNLLADLIKEELKDGRRVLIETEHAIAFVPAFARYPYETWVAPKRSVAYLYELAPTERQDLANVLKKVLMTFDALWGRPFPYLLSLFQAPTDGENHPEAHLHFEFYPPYRSQDRLKFLAGTELSAGMFVNDSAPEEKAEELKKAYSEIKNKL